MQPLIRVTPEEAEPEAGGDRSQGCPQAHLQLLKGWQVPDLGTEGGPLVGRQETGAPLSWSSTATEVKWRLVTRVLGLGQ